MAIIATVEKRPVQYRMPKMWDIKLNLTLIDDGVEVINNNYSVAYRTGDSIPSKKTEFISMMQHDIDKYKSEQVIYKAAALNAAVGDIVVALEV